MNRPTCSVLPARFACALTLLALLVPVTATRGSEAPDPPRFRRPPTAEKTPAGIAISFEVSRFTDVAVFIESGNGKIVRHLAAGVLGDAPPPAFQPRSLEQTVVWDGLADYGRPAGSGPFRVRVALQMNLSYDRVLASETQSIGAVQGLAVAPDGTLYVVHWGMGSQGSRTFHISAFNRDGPYQRQVHPFPSHLSRKQLEHYGNIFTLNGRPAPAIQRYLERRFIPTAPSGGDTMQPDLTPDGRVLLFPALGNHKEEAGSLAAIGSDGGAPWPDPVGPQLFPQTAGKIPYGDLTWARIAVASDGKSAFVAGFRADKTTSRGVLRIPLPARDSSSVFLPLRASGATDLGALAGGPGGLASDGSGRLLVCDPAGERVLIVAEADGKYLGEIPVQRPLFVGVSRETKACYVLRISGAKEAELLKFNDGPAPTPAASLKIPHIWPGKLTMAVDRHAQPPVVWIGSQEWGNWGHGNLLRVEDTGTELKPARVSGGNLGNNNFVDLTVDRFRESGPQIYARNIVGIGDRYGWLRYDEKTDRLESMRLEGISNAAGCQICPAPDGNLYSVGWWCRMYRFTHAGKPLPFTDPEAKEWPTDITYSARKSKPAGPPHSRYCKVSMTWLTHTLGVRGTDGHLFVMEPDGHEGRGWKKIFEYLPTGKKLPGRPIVQGISDGAVGPKFDAQGNLYIAEIFRPAGWKHPPEFQAYAERLKGGRKAPEFSKVYGSLLKFSPKGGAVSIQSRKMPEPGPFPEDIGKPEKILDGSWVDQFYDTYRIRVAGADWAYPGISYVCHDHCTCETTRFDVDEFGRAFFPNMALFRVEVIDTAGNRIGHFGGYGNAENQGQDSPVLDPATGAVRPRRPGESLKSPFEQPEIAFSYLVGVGATDAYVYAADALARRLLRLKLTYAAEAGCAIE